MGGLPSTVTNESIFRIPVPAKISKCCHVPEIGLSTNIAKNRLNTSSKILDKALKILQNFLNISFNVLNIILLMYGPEGNS